MDIWIRGYTDVYIKWHKDRWNYGEIYNNWICGGFGGIWKEKSVSCKVRRATIRVTRRT